MRSLSLFAVAASLAISASPVAAQTGDPPWAVPSRTPVTQTPLIVENDGARLSGTLYAPTGERPVPAVVVFHGAGAPLAEHPLYGHLKTMLPALGIAVFVYDRRGEGASTGNDARKTDFDLLASDGVAAFRTLAADPRIDANRIGFWGLSQGGWLTLLAAAREPRAAFAIAASAPMAGADVQMNFAVANVMRIKGYPQTEIDAAIGARTTVDRYVRGEVDRATAERAYAVAESRPWWRDSYLRGNLDDPTWRGQMAANPLRALDGSRVPTLILFGQGDPWVPVGRSLADLDRVRGRHPSVTVRLIDGADHSMMTDMTPAQQIDPAFFGRLAPNAPAYFAVMTEWLAATLKSRER